MRILLRTTPPKKRLCHPCHIFQWLPISFDLIWYRCQNKRFQHRVSDALSQRTIKVTHATHQSWSVTPNSSLLIDQPATQLSGCEPIAVCSLVAGAAASGGAAGGAAAAACGAACALAGHPAAAAVAGVGDAAQVGKHVEGVAVQAGVDVGLCSSNNSSSSKISIRRVFANTTEQMCAQPHPPI